jgi:hypothetical protein
VHRALAVVTLWAGLGSSLAGCGTLLGFDDLLPWPAEAGADTSPQMDGPLVIEDSAAPPGDGVAPTNCGDVLAQIDPCVAIPQFFGTQVVDGIGNEFCAIPAFDFDVKNAPASIPSPPPNLPEHVSLRVAWSQDCLHLHVHVKDDQVFVQRGTYSFDADAIEFFVSGPSLTGYSGSYDGTSDGGAIQIVISPPNPPEYPTAEAKAWWNPRRQQSQADIAEQYYAGRRVSDGYEVELKFPWPTVADAPQRGRHIAFNLGVDVRDAVDASGRQMQAFLRLPTLPGDEACGFTGGRTAEPFCDDRTWCQPELR